MKKIAQLGLLLFVVNAFSQVSKNTTSPYKQVNIRSGNQTMPSSPDRIIIPKINAFPRINTKVAQDEILVYLIAASAYNQSGFIIETSTWIKETRVRMPMS